MRAREEKRVSIAMSMSRHARWGLFPASSPRGSRVGLQTAAQKIDARYGMRWAESHRLPSTAAACPGSAFPPSVDMLELPNQPGYDVER